jgi:hypothetical protein
MPHPIPMPVRPLIVQRTALGQNAGWIARCLGLVPRTVRRLVQRLRLGGPNALATSYPSRPYPHPPKFRAVIEKALPLRRTPPPGARAWYACCYAGTIPPRSSRAEVIPAQRTLCQRSGRSNHVSGLSGQTRCPD